MWQHLVNVIMFLMSTNF